MRNFIYSFFKLRENNTTIKIEVIAGITTFLAVLYIVPLNGIIMEVAQMDKEAVITATALITIIATMATGLWANTPISMSVGLGLNSMFAHVLVKGQGLPWQTALGVVFLSGVIFILLTVTKIRKYILQNILPEFKIAISAGIGIFIAFIGLTNMKIITKDPVTIVTLGNLADKHVLLGIFGLFLVVVLLIWKVKGAFIISIVITSIVAFIFQISPIPEGIVSVPKSISPLFFQLDILSALKVSLIAPIITFMLTDLFDSLGTLAGVGHRAGIFNENESKPIQRTLEVDSIATVFGSLLGVSTTTSFIESAAGVEEGGRTGLTSVITALFFTLTLFFLPFFKSIPANAIYPVLVIVGFLMFSELKSIDFSNLEIGFPCFLIIITMPFMYSITKGLAAGFISYVFIKLVQGKVRELNPVIVILAIVSLVAFILESVK